MPAGSSQLAALGQAVGLADGAEAVFSSFADRRCQSPGILPPHAPRLQVPLPCVPAGLAASQAVRSAPASLEGRVCAWCLLCYHGAPRVGLRVLAEQVCRGGSRGPRRPAPRGRRWAGVVDLRRCDLCSPDLTSRRGGALTLPDASKAQRPCAERNTDRGEETGTRTHCR